jgi:hypothetical protein
VAVFSNRAHKIETTTTIIINMTATTCEYEYDSDNNMLLMPEPCASLGSEDPTMARMNRKHKLRSKQADDVPETKKQKTITDTIPIPLPLQSSNLAAVPGFKQGSRYEPEVPMARAALSEWRKQARRVRNRESAAASRQKTRDRIEELESEVAELHDKYEAALKRIAQLEHLTTANSEELIDTSSLVASTPEVAPTVSPPLSPRATLSFSLEGHPDLVLPSYQQSMISRPTAD